MTEKTDNLKLTAEQIEAMRYFSLPEDRADMPMRFNDPARDLIAMGLVAWNGKPVPRLIATDRGRDLLSRLDASKAVEGVELADDERERLAHLGNFQHDWRPTFHDPADTSLIRKGLVLRSDSGQYVSITLAGQAALLRRQQQQPQPTVSQEQPVEIHVNTRGCEPMDQRTAEALAEVARKLKDAYAEPPAIRIVDEESPDGTLYLRNADTRELVAAVSNRDFWRRMLWIIDDRDRLKEKYEAAPSPLQPGEQPPQQSPDGWISVESGLPEDLQNVLVFNPKYAVDTIDMDWVEDRKWWRADRPDGISHWRPLPAPPSPASSLVDASQPTEQADQKTAAMFKVGDRVLYRPTGEAATITDLSPNNSKRLRVKLSAHESIWTFESYLESIAISAPAPPKPSEPTAEGMAFADTCVSDAPGFLVKEIALAFDRATAAMRAERDAERDQHEKAILEEIDSRDHAQDALSESHVALGGDGEWVAKIPSQDAPDSGDLHRDVPALAKQVKDEADRLAAENKTLHDRIIKMQDLASHALAIIRKNESLPRVDECARRIIEESQAALTSTGGDGGGNG